MLCAVALSTAAIVVLTAIADIKRTVPIFMLSSI
jgi:hypothetical protein